MNNKLSVSLLTLIIAILFIAIGCTETENAASEEEKKELQNKISNLEEELENKKETVQNKEDKIQELETEKSEMKDPRTLELKMEQHQTFFEAALERLNEEEIREVAEKGYQYSMRVGGEKSQEIPADGKVEIDNKNFSITIDEAAPFTLKGLDENFKEKVRANRLEQKIDQEIEQEESSPYPHSGWLDVKTEGVEYEYRIGSGGGELYIFKFEEVPKGETVKIEIVPEIKEQWGLETNMLEIEVLKD